jgi:hypothetical protein
MEMREVEQLPLYVQQEVYPCQLVQVEQVAGVLPLALLLVVREERQREEQ